MYEYTRGTEIAYAADGKQCISGDLFDCQNDNHREQHRRELRSKLIAAGRGPDASSGRKAEVTITVFTDVGAPIAASCTARSPSTIASACGCAT
jgi:hypothetical protein